MNARILSITTLVLLSAAPAFAAVSRWTIDPSRTKIAFAIDAVGYPRTEGVFHKFDGRIAVDFDHPERGSVSFHVDSSSVDVGSSSFSDYVRSDAFLNAARFPSIDFVSRSVEKIDDHKVRVTGEVTLLGMTQPLVVEVAVSRESDGGRARLAFEAQTRIDRLAFGMNAAFPMVAKDVDLKISTIANEP